MPLIDANQSFSSIVVFSSDVVEMAVVWRLEVVVLLLQNMEPFNNSKQSLKSHLLFVHIWHFRNVLWSSSYIFNPLKRWYIVKCVHRSLYRTNYYKRFRKIKSCQYDTSKTCKALLNSKCWYFKLNKVSWVCLTCMCKEFNLDIKSNICFHRCMIGLNETI